MPGGLDYELEQLVNEKGAAGNMVAMDSARSFGTARGAVREMQAIDAAMKECAPHLAGRVVAYDSAGSVYREALVSMGHRDKLKGVPSNGFQAIYRLAARPGGAGVSRLAMDSAASDFNTRFPGRNEARWRNGTRLMGKLAIVTDLSPPRDQRARTWRWRLRNAMP